MTRKHLRSVVISVVAVYLAAMAAGICLRIPFAADASSYYLVYRDLIPLIIAVPAACLALGFQRRLSYLQALRALWSHMVGAISAALTYTESPWPSEEQYLATLARLSAAIEEVRGVFTNVPARGIRSGWYPFEPVKKIYQEIHGLGFGPAATADRRAAVRANIYSMWKRSREQLLAEFDRDRPMHHGQYAPRGPRHEETAPASAGTTAPVPSSVPDIG